MTAAIQVTSVSKRYGSLVALDAVDLRIESGEFFGLLGPNGAGKTTLISIVAGLVRATAGRVAIMGHDVVDDFRAARLAVGVVPQELAFDPFFTVRETLTFQSGYFGLRHNAAWIDEVLANLGLAGKADANTRALSGGMKRRLLVAQALVHKPPVIVLDEPTAGVDVELRQTLWQFIRRLNREGHTIVLTTHYLEEAQALCERIAMLKAGRIVALDTTRALLAHLAGLQLTMRPRGTPPPSVLAHRIGERDGVLTLRLADAAGVARVLSECAAAGCVVEDLEVGHADLEDVFLQLMSEHPWAAMELVGA
ncbi:MAG TPA: ABC transporter ATP-binding protein [Burkholderiaceae bacterium]|nr:ABC transporter ATP-binding protein [Burkholderiaceae bacterium]